jgi:hypothetical protein
VLPPTYCAAIVEWRYVRPMLAAAKESVSFHGRTRAPHARTHRYRYGASRCCGVLGLAGGLGSHGNGFLASIYFDYFMFLMVTKRPVWAAGCLSSDAPACS